MAGSSSQSRKRAGREVPREGEAGPAPAPAPAPAPVHGQGQGQGQGPEAERVCRLPQADAPLSITRSVPTTAPAASEAR